MARDSSRTGNRKSSTRQPRPNQRSTQRRRKPATNTRRPAQKRGAPGWLWFVSGLCVAIAAAAVFYILQQPVDNKVSQTEQLAHPNGGAPPVQSPKKQSAGSKPPAAKSSTAPSADAQKKPQFSFYRMLPNYQSAMSPPPPPANKTPSPTAKSKPREQPSNTADNRPERQKTAPTQKMDVGGADNTAYVIQAGAFSDRPDAEKRSAQLTLLGVDAHVVAMTLGSGKTVYRVQSQAIDSQSRMTTLRQRLQAKNIDVMVRHVDGGD